MKNFLITGCAGFIGYHFCSYILKNNNNINIIGIDNINDYYDINLKKSRLANLKKSHRFKFKKIDISNYSDLLSIFKSYKIFKVVNLAAQAGVRMSLINKQPYYNSNILGFYNIINLCNDYDVKHLLYASSSSVYGNANIFPLNEKMETSNNISFYASTKKINEIMAYNFSYAHKLKTTGLRIFTAYGPYGRPDMAIYKIIDSIIKEKEMIIFDEGTGLRDFTYVEDTVNAIYQLTKLNSKLKDFEIFNIASGNCIELNKIISILEILIGKKLKRKNKHRHLGDVSKTHGDNKKLRKAVKIKFTPLQVGLNNYLDWYLRYHKN